MKIMVALGNPGDKYKNTRHNAAWLLMDKLTEKHGLAWRENKKLHSLTAGDGAILYLKPLTFMNNSGQAVRAVLDYYKLMPKKYGLLTPKQSDLSDILTVVHDDLDIGLGKYKISVNSRSAGHNGVESIIKRLKTKNFTRLRLGIKGGKPDQMPAVKYVLGRFGEEERGVLDGVLEEIADKEGL